MVNRIRGNKLSLKIGSPAVDYMTNATSVVLSNEEANAAVVTFEDAAGDGGRQYFLNITAVQSTDADSLWTFIWDNTGEEVAFTYAPHANTTPTADEPHFSGIVRIGPRGDIGGDAVRNGGGYTFTTRWDVVGSVAKVSA